MHRRLLSSLALTAVFAAACGDDAPSDDRPDAGPTDAASAPDTGPADTGAAPADMGVRDTGEQADMGPRDLGLDCVEGSVSFDGVDIPLAATTGAPTVRGDSPASTGCFGREPTPSPMARAVCFTQCLDFLGFTPTPAQVEELQFDVFRASSMSGEPVDPTFDRAEGTDRSPNLRTSAGARTVRAAVECESGWKIELGYASLGDALESDVNYVIRARSGASLPTWVPSYLWNYIRRLDQATTDCSDETRQPDLTTDFVVVAESTLTELIGQAGAPIPGAENFRDERGPGHALVETRDCTGFKTENLTAGFSPAPARAGYLDVSAAFESAGTRTSEYGTAVGLGFGAATSSAAQTVRVAVGIDRRNVCTEAFGATRFPVFPDAVTVVRTDRETTITQ